MQHLLHDSVAETNHQGLRLVRSPAFLQADASQLETFEPGDACRLTDIGATCTDWDAKNQSLVCVFQHLSSCMIPRNSPSWMLHVFFSVSESCMLHASLMPMEWSWQKCAGTENSDRAELLVVWYCLLSSSDFGKDMESREYQDDLMRWGWQLRADLFEKAWKVNVMRVGMIILDEDNSSLHFYLKKVSRGNQKNITVHCGGSISLDDWLIDLCIRDHDQINPSCLFVFFSRCLMTEKTSWFALL